MSDETRAPELIASVAVFLPLALIAVAVRLWVRTRMIRNFGWDDGMMVLALANFIVYCTSLMIIVAHGGGTRRAHLVHIRVGIVWTVTAQVSYLTSLLFLKLSLGLFFLRVVQVKWQRRVIWAAMILSTVVQTYHAILIVFGCGNPMKYPEHILAKKCIPRHIQVDLAYEQAAITTFTDFVFALMPIPLLWNTTLDRRAKLSVAFVLLLATSGCICSIIRFRYISGLGAIEDFFWTAANIAMWSLYEIAAGIIAGSLATMRPLYSKFMYKARNMTHAGRSRKDSHTNLQGSRARMLSRKKSYASSTTRSQKTINEWTKTVDYTDHNTYTSTCFAGTDYDYAEALRDDEEMRRLPTGKASRKPSSESARAWPRDDQSIHKTVQIEVRSSQDDDQPWASAGGGTWSQRVEDLLKTPPKIRKGSRDDDSIPEWDKLPDLIPPSRKGSEDSQRARPPPLVRITTR